ncbi:hypothetical protein HGRIS_011334 [Hohenbuehelia grisea]|uniref:Heterokaryon incompatibility domain-containing protein n=1 Tax=Hohenbuehelia grisea TaxID=104357 RepID=A0ABR3JVQ6_9AGAR
MTTTIPFQWRFIDAQKFLLEGSVEIWLLPHLPKEFVAISYTWSPAIKTWRDNVIAEGVIDRFNALQIARERVELGTLSESSPLVKNLDEHQYETHVTLGSRIISNRLPFLDDPTGSMEQAFRFMQTVAFLVHSRRQRWFWIDILCINQDDIREKEFFVPKMGELYRSALETHVYLFGTSFPSELTSIDIYGPLWMTRAWTLQEHLLSKAVFFCYTFTGDIAHELRRFLTYDNPTVHSFKSPRPIDFSDQAVRPAKDLPFDWVRNYVIASGAAHVTTWGSSGRATTCILEPEFTNGLGPWFGGALCDKVSQVLKDDFDPSRRALTYNNYCLALYANIFKHVARAERGSPREIARLMADISRRHSTVAVDQIYSILEMLDRTDFPVSYAADPQEVRLSIFESMPEDSLAATLGTEWGCYVNSAHRESALPRIYHTSPLPSLEIEEISALAHFERSTGTRIYAKMAQFRIWMNVEAVWHTLQFQATITQVEPRATESRRKEIRCLTVMKSVNLAVYPEYANCSTDDIPSEVIRSIFLDSATRRATAAMDALFRTLETMMGDRKIPWWTPPQLLSSFDMKSSELIDDALEKIVDETPHLLEEIIDLLHYDESVEIIELGQCRHTYWYGQRNPSELQEASIVSGGGNLMNIRVDEEDPEKREDYPTTKPYKGRDTSLIGLECCSASDGDYTNRGTVIVEYAGTLSTDFNMTLVK